MVIEIILCVRGYTPINVRLEKIKRYSRQEKNLDPHDNYQSNKMQGKSDKDPFCQRLSIRLAFLQEKLSLWDNIKSLLSIGTDVDAHDAI